MAAAAAGSRENQEFGFTPDDTGVIDLDENDLGFIQGDIENSWPREYGYLKLDQDRVRIDAVCVMKQWIVTFGLGEPILENHQYAMDNDAPSTGVLTVDGDMGSTVDMDINTNPPNDTGDDTRVLNIPKALSIGDGTYTVAQSANQTISGVSFEALADSNGLLGTITDVYT